MVQIIQAKTVTLRTLIDDFGIQFVDDRAFFPEWQGNLPEVSDLEKEQLRRIRDGFVNLLNYPPLLEGVIRMSVVDPLLFLAGFYLPPFHVRSEPSIEIQTEEEDILITGSLDTLVLKDRLWVLVVESKRASYSVEAGLAQILAYMLASPNPDQSCYGMITSGGSFMFIKLMKGNLPRYAVSKLFGIRELDDLISVFAILKRLGQLVE
ncbi:restriction endonuclease subunit R [Leptolyngbya sp. FACHB-711]|uniref:restriction endonuclease subunit R n=1 Tax=unclassified Leptolyngbya TaxID=2650499 RepID=UPI00168A016C|nr:restriction endonuclease subunit R [Leptolyngbya sp. FACHB-711]MBD1852080.1 restriction endonuclease subunit R [Cyanobacteria bacterium FACHB-502]MBD2026567.1 restriction endonuclease subunit R [Leptolyngbya sp. FACHB-711]